MRCYLFESGVGKTVFIRRHQTGEFETKYIGRASVAQLFLSDFRVFAATESVQIVPIDFYTTLGWFTCLCYDYPGLLPYTICQKSNAFCLDLSCRDLSCNLVLCLLALTASH